MKQEINASQFMNEFKAMDRDYYSWEGYQALYDYYDEFEEFNLDVIAICCDVSEYTEEELLKDYEYILTEEDYKNDNYDDIVEMSDEEYGEQYLEDFIKELENKTTVIKLSNGSFLVWEF